jgi:hypothetical protein
MVKMLALPFIRRPLFEVSRIVAFGRRMRHHAGLGAVVLPSNDGGPIVEIPSGPPIALYASPNGPDGPSRRIYHGNGSRTIQAGALRFFYPATGALPSMHLAR